MPIPKITDIIDECCREVKAVIGHDVDATEGRAFMKRFFIRLNKMTEQDRERFIKKYLKYYAGK